jgi:outer membrane protein TolC
MKQKNLFLKGIGWAALLACLLPGTSLLSAEDLNLEQAITLALERNERSLAAGEQLRAAQGVAAQARAYFFPAVSLTGNLTRRPNAVERELNGQTITIQSVNAVSAYASLNWILFNPTVIPNYRQAHFAERSQRYSTAEIRRRLSFEVAAAFLATLTLDQVHEAAGNRLEYAASTLGAARARYAAGLVSVNDVTRAELEYASAEMGATQTQGAVRTAYLQLGYLLDSDIAGKLAAPGLLLAQAEQPAAASDELLPGPGSAASTCAPCPGRRKPDRRWSWDPAWSGCPA